MKLHLGCGHKYLDGWVNVDCPAEDIIYSDLKADVHAKIEDLEYSESSVDEILMEAAFEHFPRHTAVMLLRRMYLWLKPGGKLTILVPDFWGTVKMLKKSVSPQERQFWYRHLFGPQDTITYGTHYDAFDLEKLEWLFSVVGFNETTHTVIKRWPYIRFSGIKNTPVKSTEQAHRDIINYIAHSETAEEKGMAFDAWIKAMGLSAQKPETGPFKTHTMYKEATFFERLRSLLGRRK